MSATSPKVGSQYRIEYATYLALILAFTTPGFTLLLPFVEKALGMALVKEGSTTEKNEEGDNWNEKAGVPKVRARDRIPYGDHY